MSPRRREPPPLIDEVRSFIERSRDLGDLELEALEPWAVAASRGDVRILVFEVSAARRKPQRFRSLAGDQWKSPLAYLAVLEGRESPALAKLLGQARFDYVTRPLEGERFRRTLHNLLDVLHLEADTIRARMDVLAGRQELSELYEIGIALSAERNTDRLLSLIVEKGRDLTKSDAGSIYIVETDGDGPSKLRFRVAQNDSVVTPFSQFTLDISPTSIAGYVAYRGKSLNIPDAYKIGGDAEYRFNRSFDEKWGYRTKSVLAVPMRNRAGEITGVLQLMNRKRDPKVRLVPPEVAEREVLPYDQSSVELATSLASHAAVSLENAVLYEEIQHLFDAFVRASVSAIESRDPTTSGHSERVAKLTVGLAEAADRSDAPRFRDVRFKPQELKEIEYAALLHDFGKIGVRERVLVKANKLYEGDFSLIESRMAFIRRSLEAETAARKVRLLTDRSPGWEEGLARLDQELAERIRELEEDLRNVRECNRPTVLQEGNFELLKRIAARTYRDLEGRSRPYLEEDELKNLSIPKGSLNDQERLEIESHVTHTFHYLKQIPWSKALKRIPDIAHAHHEKLNGRGYPRHIPGGEIPIQSRMLTICDIYDALTAKDRPYKKAVPRDRAIEILKVEAREGQLDQEILDLFLAAEVFRKSEAA